MLNDVYMEIVHRLPGRIRLRLSQAVRDPDRLLATVREHEGLTSVAYTPASRSVLAYFDPNQFPEEEIVLRVALSLGLDAGAVPVHVRGPGDTGHMTTSSWLAGALILAAGGQKLLGRSTSEQARWDWLAAMATMGSVLHHGWSEIDERGYFDPEVLSLGFLATAFMRGNLLRAAALTWAATFGRHLLQGGVKGIVVRPVQTSVIDGVPRYEVAVSPEVHTPGRTRVRTVVKGLLDYVMAGGGSRDLLGDMRRVSHGHGEVLEGMGWMPNGIPLRFKT